MKINRMIHGPDLVQNLLPPFKFDPTPSLSPFPGPNFQGDDNAFHHASGSCRLGGYNEKPTSWLNSGNLATRLF